MFTYEQRQPTLKGALSWGQDGDTEVAESVRRRGLDCSGGQIAQMPTLADARAYERGRRDATPPCMPTLRDARAFHSQRAQSRAAAAAALQPPAAWSSSSGSDSSAGSRLESPTSERRRREALVKQWWIDRVVAKGKMRQVRSHAAD